METKVFVLKNKKMYRRFVKIYIPKINGEGLISKLLLFTTQHLVTGKDRSKNAKNYHAEYATSDPEEIQSLMSSDGYGTVYTLKNDLEGKLKQPKRRSFTNLDMRKAGLEALFDEAGLNFDNSKSLDVLKAEYAGYVAGMSGGAGIKKQEKEQKVQIPVEQTNVFMGIENAKNQARAAYFNKYGEVIPEVVYDDIAFLDGLSNPNFDAQAYIANVSKKEDDPWEGYTVQDLGEKYVEKFGKLPPNVHKNNPTWLKLKLAE